MLSYIKKTFSFDDRSLALYRFLIGFVVIADVLYRVPDLVNFYTDVGLVPRGTFINEMAMPWSLSFHLGNGSLAFAIFMFSVHFILGLMLVFGYKTRWAVIGAYLMTVSVHNRNWLVNNGGDDILRAILLISIFLPLNRTFSIDSALKKEKRETEGFLSTWVLAFMLQIFVIYFVSFILKNHPIWKTELTAFFYSSRLDIFATPFGIWLRNFDRIGKFVTAFSILLEWLGPLLLCFSFIFGRFWWVFRTAIVVLFIGFHGGIFLCMNIGVFTFICEAMWTVTLPGTFWDRIEAYFKSKKYNELTLYFDGECGFCQKGVRILREFLLMKDVEIKVAQETPDIFKDMERETSWVVVNGSGERFYHYNAFLEIIKHSPVARWSLFFFASKPVSWIGGQIYRWISHNRSAMGKMTQFLEYTSPKKEIKTLRWILEGVGAFVFVTILMWNLTTIKILKFEAPFFQSVTRWIHIYQEWNMFAPFPKMDNVWIEVPGVLSDGSEIELITGSRDIYSIKDQDFVKSIPNEHWRKFYLNMSERHDYARYYGGFLCRKWNERKIQMVPGTTLRKMELVVYSQLNLPNGDRGGISRKLSWRHWCFDEDYRRDNNGANPR